jgi:hypothetical protein
VAKTVYTTEDIELQDGTEVTLKPATIKVLRKFMKMLNEMTNLTPSEGEEDDLEDRSIDLLLKMAGLLLEREIPEKVKQKGWLEETLDMPTVYKVIEVCGGVKLNDPKMLERVMDQMSEAGTN